MRVVTEADGVMVEERLLRFFSTSEEFMEKSNTCLEAIANVMTFVCDACELQVGQTDSEETNDHESNMGSGESINMYLLHYEATDNHNDLHLCRDCYERGAPPEGSISRPWPQSGLELLTFDLRHPHVVLGPQLSEVSDHHRTAHRSVAQQLAKQLQAWGFDIQQFEDPSDAIVAMMRRFRSSKPAIMQMVQHRVQHVATACGFEGAINFAKADYQKLKQLDSDIYNGLCCAEFQEKVQEIVQASGSAAERGRALENAIADKECQIFAEHGLQPNFQGKRRVWGGIHLLHHFDLPSMVTFGCDCHAPGLLRINLTADVM